SSKKGNDTQVLLSPSFGSFLPPWHPAANGATNVPNPDTSALLYETQVSTYSLRMFWSIRYLTPSNLNSFDNTLMPTATTYFPVTSSTALTKHFYAFQMELGMNFF